jgi:hypothetical protein
MAESINLTVDRREDLFVQVYWTNLDDIPYYIVAGMLDAASGANVLLSSDPSYGPGGANENASKYAIHDTTTDPNITSQNLSITSASGLVTISVAYSVVSGWSTGNYPYSLVVKYAASSTTATTTYRKVLMTGTIEVV